MNESTFYAVSAQTLPVLALAAILELRWFLDGVLVTAKGRRTGRYFLDIVAVLQGLGIILTLLILPQTISAAASPSEAPDWLRPAISIALQLVVLTLLLNPAVAVMGRLRYPPEPVPPLAELRKQNDEAEAELLRVIAQDAANRHEVQRRADRSERGTTRVLAVVGIAAVLACLRRRR